MPEKYRTFIPFVNPAPIDLEAAKKQKKAQAPKAEP
jgi:hypothetical protein